MYRINDALHMPKDITENHEERHMSASRLAQEALETCAPMGRQSSVNFDQAGRLTDFTDPRGRRVAFSDYDDNGNPKTVENPMGRWHNVGTDMWAKEGSDTIRYIHIEVNKNGYSYSDLNGRKVTRNADGSTIQEERGLKVITDVNGKQTKEWSDGTNMYGQPQKGKLDFNVQKGTTTAGRLHIDGGKFEVVHGRGGDVHAQVEAEPNSPVAALQDGLVVYTYNNDPAQAGRIAARGNSVTALSAADMAVIDHYKQSNPNEDIVVMQCYDPKTHGMRMEIYAGLALADTAPGDRVKAGTPLGKAGERGFAFGARRGRLSGAAVELAQ